MDITELLAFSVKHNASDLQLSAGLPPMIRVDGDIRRVNVPALDHKTVHGLVYDIMNDKQRRDYEEFLEVDFSFEIPGLARFRVNAFNQDRGAAAVFRTIPSKVLTLDDLQCPSTFKTICENPRGIVQACLRPRERFWNIPVPKIDSAFDNLLVPQPSWSPSTTCRVPCDYIPKRSYPLFRTRQILNDWLTQNLEEA